MHHHDVGFTAKACDRCDVADEIEIELVVERGVDRVRRSDKEKRIAVRRCAHDYPCGYVAACTGSVLDDKWLAQLFGQPLTHQARQDVGRTAWRKADDDMYRPRRIGLRPCDARYGRQSGSTGCQMQE
jgi:hypothetical protein